MLGQAKARMKGGGRALAWLLAGGMSTCRPMRRAGAEGWREPRWQAKHGDRRRRSVSQPCARFREWEEWGRRGEEGDVQHRGRAMGVGRSRTVGSNFESKISKIKYKEND